MVEKDQIGPSYTAILSLAAEHRDSVGPADHRVDLGAALLSVQRVLEVVFARGARPDEEHRHGTGDPLWS